LIYAITAAFDNKTLICVDTIFLDYSNAFDTVSHSELVNELQTIGIVVKILNIIVGLLSERRLIASSLTS
jgi:hypothetical protein